MGTNLGELVETEELTFADMHDKAVAVDALNTLYQFLSIIRQRDGTPLKDSQGRVTSHLSGLFYRTVKLFDNNIRPVYVYDGEAPELKATEAAERRKRREEAEEEWKRLKEEGKLKEAFTKATQSSNINDTMLEESKKLLDAMGVPYVQAPSEGEAQCAAMNRAGNVWAAGSQDWDVLLFGAERMVKNLTSTGKRKVPGKQTYRKVVPETVVAERVFTDLGVTREKLVWMGIMMGTDYNPGGVKGIGPKTALKLAKEYDSFAALQEDDTWAWEHDVDPVTVRDFFMDPPVDPEAGFDFTDPDEERVRELLVEEHDFSEDRIAKQLDTFVEAMRERQAGLGSFMG